MATRHPERYARLVARLRKAREDANLTQEGVAASLGTTQIFISRIETGERRIDPVELQEFAELYGKPITYFLD